MRIAVGLASCAVALAGCTPTVSGSGVLASVATSPTPPPLTKPAFPSATPPTPTPTVVPSTPEPTIAGPSAAAGLVCPSKAVTAANAPFCYRLPPGFTDYSNLNNYGAGWTFRTLVSVGRHDLIEVLGYEYKTSTDSLSDAALRQFYNRSGRLNVGKLNVTQAGPVQATRVDGSRAFQQEARYRDGVRTRSMRVYSGRTVISIECQSKAKPAVIAHGCESIRSTIQIAHT